MADEGRLLSPEEARPRRRIAEKARKNIPKISVKQIKTLPVNSSDLSKKIVNREFYIEKKVKGVPISKVRVIGDHITQAMRDFSVKNSPITKTGLFDVDVILPLKAKGEDVKENNLRIQHKSIKNTVLSPKDIREAATKATKILPDLETISGQRITGMKVREIPGRKIFKSSAQVIPVGKLKIMAERAAQKSKAGKAFTAALRATRLAKKVLK